MHRYLRRQSDFESNAIKSDQGSIVFDGHIGLPGELAYYPGTQVSQKSIYRVEGRMSRFTAKIRGFGECVFTSIEDAIIDKETRFGKTDGRITVKSSQGFIVLVAESSGIIYLSDRICALEFRAHFQEIGEDQNRQASGNYVGYFIPDGSPRAISGFLHMELML
jgi:hypothetical protein